MKKFMPLRSIDRTYKSAIDILNSRRRIKRPSISADSNASKSIQIPNAKGTPDLKGTPSIVGMKEWLREIGHSTAEIDSLNIIHVAGTKGKGSTAAFIESFLRAFGRRTGFPRKTGLYTSPHLIFPEERIRINFRPIDRTLFAKYFFEVWDALSKDGKSSRDLPRYLQLMALVSFHAFIKEGVEAAVFETHHGGEYDATNVIENPVATVITPLGMDHVKQLGPNIENIAWHKAGIFKRGSHAISAPQDPSPAKVLRSRASEKSLEVEFVGNDLDLPADVLQLTPDVQRMNSSVALATVRRFIHEKAPEDSAILSSSDISQGIEQFSWPGRFQLLVKGPFKWFLDGAHNEMSVTKAVEWYIEASDKQTPPARILIFSQITEARDSTIVFERLAAALSKTRVNHVIFTVYDPKHDFDSPGGETNVAKPDAASQKAFGEIWQQYHPNSRIHYEPNIQQALDSARKIGTEASGMHTLITGSQHLVGGALFSLNDYASTRESSRN